MAVVLVYDRERDAEMDVSILKGTLLDSISIMSQIMWRDLFSNVDTWSDGRVLLGKLRTDRPTMWLRVFVSQDSLFVHK